MTYKEYLEFIINKLAVELTNAWTVEIISYVSAYDKHGTECKRIYTDHQYLHITDGRWHFSFETLEIERMYYELLLPTQIYHIIKNELERAYLKNLWKNVWNF